MNSKNTLAITIPTFNRSTILNTWLEKHARLMQFNGIKIHIQDNFSSDETAYLLKDWQKKFSNISFAVNKKNLHDKNFEVCLNAVNANYVWLMGDSYLVDNDLLNKVLSIIKKYSPLFIITNLKGRIKKLNDSFLKPDFVCQRLAGILSCISCTIYNKKILGIIKFKELSWSHFAHTIYILNELKLRNSKAYWTASSVYTLPLKKNKRVNWASTEKVFEIGAKNWIESMDSLKYFNDTSKKKSYRLFSELTSLFDVKGGLWLRAQGLLTLSAVKSFKVYLKKSAGIKYFLLYIIAVLPIFILKNLKKIYYKCFLKF
jgi:abequosyltransferase